MIYVDTGIAKLNHFTTAISSGGEILIEPFEFSDNYNGSYLLLSHLAPLDQNSIIIGLESTVHYSDNLIHLLVSKGFKMCVPNPIQTSFMCKNNIRKTKTNKVDTFVITKALMIQDSLRLMALEDLDYIKLKELGKFHQKFVEQRTRLKIQLTPYVDQAFPELQYLFRFGLYRNSVYAVFKEVPTPNAIAFMHLTHLVHTLEITPYNCFGKDKARELRVLAQKSVGVSDSSLSTQITHTIEQIELLDSQLFSTELEMANLVTCLHSVIMATPGVGVVNGEMVPGEIGDIHRFSNLEKLLIFAGLGPTAYQSENSQAHGTRMSKRGSKVPYYTLMSAAHDVVENNTILKAYHDAKRAEGRTRYNILGHCVGEPARVIWKIPTDEVAFNLE